MNIPEYVPEGPRHIFMSIFVPDVRLRPTANELYSDPWV